MSAGYKWWLCPYGFGLMYVAPAWHNARPLEESRLARANAADFTGLVDYSDTDMPGAAASRSARSATRSCRARFAWAEEWRKGIEQDGS